MTLDERGLIELWAKQVHGPVSTKLQAFVKRVYEATDAACSQPGCEVRVTCESPKEVESAQALIEDWLKAINFLDVKRTHQGQIELNSGSCILLRVQS